MRRIRENDGQNKEKRMNMSGRKGEDRAEFSNTTLALLVVESNGI